MSWFQRFLTVRPLGPDLRARMEAESRQWIVRCLTCGHESSVWEMGGVRYRAAGRSYSLMRCKPCGRLRCHLIYWGGPGATPPPPIQTKPTTPTATPNTGGRT